MGEIFYFYEHCVSFIIVNIYSIFREMGEGKEERYFTSLNIVSVLL